MCVCSFPALLTNDIPCPFQLWVFCGLTITLPVSSFYLWYVRLRPGPLVPGTVYHMQEDSGLTVCTGENHTEICLGPQCFDVVPRCCAELDPLGLQQQTKARSTSFASSISKCLFASFISLRCLCGTVPKEFKRFVKGSPCCLWERFLCGTLVNSFFILMQFNHLSD